MNIWWCTQRKNWDLERSTGVLCSPDDVSILNYRKTVGDVQRGDVVVHYKFPSIVAFSRAKEDGRYNHQLPPLGGKNYGSGWRFETEYFDLIKPIHRDIFSKRLVPLIVRNYPLDKRGIQRQGYLFPFDHRSLKVLLSIISEPLPNWLEALRAN